MPITNSLATEPSPITNPQNPPIPTDGLRDLGGLLEIFFAWALRLLGLSVMGVFMYSGIQMFFARGNMATFNAAKERMYDAGIGALILLSAYLILYTINPDLVGGGINLPGI